MYTINVSGSHSAKSEMLLDLEKHLHRFLGFF